MWLLRKTSLTSSLQDLTTIVSKAWKDIPEEQKEEFNARAAKMKEEYLKEESTKSSDNNKSSDEAESSKEEEAY